MKNLYLCMAILLFSASNSFAQDLQNANWVLSSIFGITFTTTPISQMPSPAGSPDYGVYEGTASVSDDNGNLLLFTNGEGVWRRMADGTIVQIESGLFGDRSSSQNAVIVHRPGHPNNYYIFTNKGWSGDQTNLGAHYCEIELTPTTSITHFKNYPLKTYSPGNTITDNESEAITCSKHPDNYRYWVSIGVDSQSANKHEIWSYIVSENGVQPIPDQISVLPLQSDAVTMCFKIKDAKIGVGTNGDGTYLGTFDSTTGLVSLNATPVGGPTTTVGICHSLEFSPSGNYLYTMFDYLGTYWEGKVLCVNTASPNTLIIPNLGNTENVYSLQMGIDNQIHMMVGGSTIRTITNPENPSNPMTQSLYGSNLCSGLFCRGRFPQLVQIQPIKELCPSYVFTDTVVVAPNIENLQASETIEAKSVFNVATSGIYHAGNKVVLLPGFKASNGSIFRAYIEGCEKPEAFIDVIAESYAEEHPINKEVKKEYVIISPNPSSSVVEISLENLEMKNIIITSMDGRVMFERNLNNTLSYKLDISNYDKGIYMVTVGIPNGKTITGKIIKN